MEEGSSITIAVQAEGASRGAAPLAPLTIANALAAVASWQDLAEQRRAVLASALRRAARIAGLPPGAVRADCATLSQAIFAQPPAAYDLNADSFANLLSNLRYVLRRLGLHAPHLRGRDGFTEAWQHALDELPEECARWPLLRLARWASAAGRTPTELADADLVAFTKWLTDCVLMADPKGRARDAARALQRLRGPNAGTGSVSVPKGRTPYTVPIETYSASFQADVGAFLARFEPAPLDVLFADLGTPGPAGRARRPARAATLKARAFQIRQAAAALVHSGIPVDQLRDLSNLVDPFDHALRIVRFYRDRAGTQRNSQTHGVASVLRIIARHHARLDDDAVAKIADLCARVAPEKGQGLTTKNRGNLRALIEPHRRMLLLLLPETLMKEAAAVQGARPKEAGRLAMMAAIIEIALICPLRLANLAGLHLDRNLRRGGRGGRVITHLIIEGADTKNGAAIEWPVPPESAALLDRYITVFRPLLPNCDGAYVIPGEAAPARSANSLGMAIKREVTQRIGVPVNAHLFRHFAAWMHLQRFPGDYGAVRRILGHKSVETTIAHYVGLETDAVARRFDANVLHERQVARVLMAAQRRRAA